MSYFGHEIETISDLVKHMVTLCRNLTMDRPTMEKVVDRAMDISGTLLTYKNPWTDLDVVSCIFSVQF